MERPFVKGAEIETIRSVKSLKIPMINLFRTYPTYMSYGIIETYFDGNLGNQVVDILYKDGLIEVKEGTCPRQYRLTPKGIDFAISMINLEYSERVLRYSKSMNRLTIGVIILSVLTLGLSILQLFVA